MDFSDIYMNQTKITEIFNKQESRTGRFEKQLVQHHKSYGNKIFKKRHDEYFDCAKQDRYKTPFLRLRDHHRWNIGKLTKAQKKEEIKWLEERHNKKQVLIPNYILAYEDDSVPMTSDKLVATLGKMGDESTAIFDASQGKMENKTINNLIEVLAAAKLDQMSAAQLINAMDEQKKQKSVDDNRQTNNQPSRKPSTVSVKIPEEAESSFGTESEQDSTEANQKKEVDPVTQQILRRDTTNFSFQERFKAFVGLKVIDNMELLQEKRRKEFMGKVRVMMNGDIDKFNNADFRSFIDNSNPDNMLVDLTHQFIHRAIVIGVQAQKQGKKSHDLIEENHEQFKKDSHKQAKTRKRKGQSGKKHSNSLESTISASSLTVPRPEDLLFMPNLGIDFRKVKSMYDIKDRETLFYKVQYVLEHLDKERYKNFRSGILSMPQCISRIENESKNGIKYTVLDDLRHGLSPQALRNPSKAIKMAYQEQVIEDRLLRNAKKRGIDPQELKKTARNLNVQERCAKSMYARPIRKVGCNPDDKQNFKIREIIRDQNQKRKKEQDEKKHENLVEQVTRKDANTQRVLYELSQKDPREIYRDSGESKIITQRLYGGKYYFIPERYREALLQEFYKTYEAQKKNVQKGESGPTTQTEAATGKKVRLTVEQQQERTQEALRKKKQAEAEWFDQMGIPQPMDEDERMYLKRVRQACPKANVVLPDGFFDSDEEEEERERKMLMKRLSSNLMIYDQNEAGELIGGSPAQKKKPDTSKGLTKWATGDVRVSSGNQYLQARSISQQSGEDYEENTMGIRRHAETLSDRETIHQIQTGKSIELQIDQSDGIGENEKTEVSITVEDLQSSHHEGGGIVEDPRQRKRIVSEFEKRHHTGSALDGVHMSSRRQYVLGNIGQYVLGNIAEDQQHAFEIGRNTQMLEPKKNSNFPLTTMSKPMIESGMRGDVSELHLKDFANKGRRLNKNQSQAFAFKRKSHLNKSMMDQSLNGKAKEKELSQQTLVIGGLVKRPTSVVKNKSALSKEYHQRHTRHIRGQSALARPQDKASYQRYNRSSLQQSTIKFQHQSIDQQPQSNIAPSEQQKVPESVIEWYNEMIGPLHVTQKIPKQSDENSLMDYDCNQTATDTGTEANGSSFFYKPRDSKGISTATSRVKKLNNRSFAVKKQKMSLVGQQTPFMTLNQDITDEDVDFAFTVQGTQDKIGSATCKGKLVFKDFNLNQAQTQTAGSKGILHNITANQSLQSPGTMASNTKSMGRPVNQVEGHQDVEQFNKGEGGELQQTNADSFELNAIQTSEYAQRKSYNWLTGAAMTNENVQRLNQVTENMIIDKAGGKSVFIHERAPRQLLVNQSILRKNQLYRQQSAAIQTNTPIQEGIDSGERANYMDVSADKRQPITRFIDPSTPEQTSISDKVISGRAQEYYSMPPAGSNPAANDPSDYQTQQQQENNLIIPGFESSEHGPGEKSFKAQSYQVMLQRPLTTDPQTSSAMMGMQVGKQSRNPSSLISAVLQNSQPNRGKSFQGNCVPANSIFKAMASKRGIQIGGKKPGSTKAQLLNQKRNHKYDNGSMSDGGINVIVKGRNVAQVLAQQKSITKSPASPFAEWRANVK